MGFETDLFTTLTFSRKTYNTKHEVEEELMEVAKLIDYYENKLYALGMMTEPKKFCDEDEDPLAYVNSEIRLTLEEIRRSYIDQYKLNILLDTWNATHDSEGYAIKRPECIPRDASYLDGDFINHK